MKKICVFCGSSRGNNPVYVNAANEFGQYLVSQKIDLVYGGSHIGIMGILADTVLENGGRVYGVITRQLQSKEIAHTGITKLHVVETMHERKAMMENLSDGFVALPGGVGTLDEIVEIFTWSQLSIHRKPFGFLNINNYFNRLHEFFRHMMTEGFLNEKYFHKLIISNNPAKLIETLKSYNYEPVSKWPDK